MPDPDKWQVAGAGHKSLFQSKSPSHGQIAKTTTSEVLGPGCYLGAGAERIGHTEYEFSRRNAPFNRSSQRFAPRPRTVAETFETVDRRGPGMYMGHDEWQTRPNSAPFLARKERMPARVTSPTGEQLGPGSYTGYEEYNHKRGGAPFGRRSGRFPVRPKAVSEDYEVLDNRGPGTYIGHEEWQVKSNSVPFLQRTPRTGPVKTPTSAVLGPGAYIGHDEYPEQAHGRRDVGFGRKEQRMQKEQASVGDTPEAVASRGPGMYLGHTEWTVAGANAPFNAKQQRWSGRTGYKAGTSPELGPGVYLGHEDYPMDSSAAAFGARTQRFHDPQAQKKVSDTQDLGPGSYLGHKSY